MREVSDDSMFTDEPNIQSAYRCPSFDTGKKTQERQTTSPSICTKRFVCYFCFGQPITTVTAFQKKFGCGGIKNCKGAPLTGLYNGSMEILRVTTLNGKRDIYANGGFASS